MKKAVWIIIVVLVAGGVFAYKVRQQQQEIAAIPSAQIAPESGLAQEESESPKEVPVSDQGGSDASEELVTQNSEQTDSDSSVVDISGASETPDAKGFDIVVTSTPAGITQETQSDIEVDLDQSFLTFEGYAPGKSHVGSFETLEAAIQFDEVKTVTGGRLLVEAASVKTDALGLDAHLKTEDFFDVDTYPTIEYVLESVVFNNGSGEASAQGTLVFRGITKEITVPVTILPNGFNTSFNLSLKEFGIIHTGVNDDVTIGAQIVLQ